eukprot:gene57611-biopygen51182
MNPSRRCAATATCATAAPAATSPPARWPDARKRYRGALGEGKEGGMWKIMEDHGRVAVTFISRAQIPTLPPSDWAKYTDQASGKPYWHNPKTNTTTWDEPEEAKAT